MARHAVDCGRSAERVRSAGENALAAMIENVDFHAQRLDFACKIICGEVEFFLFFVQARFPYLRVAQLVLHGDGGNFHAPFGISADKRRDVLRPQRVIFAL